MLWWLRRVIENCRVIVQIFLGLMENFEDFLATSGHKYYFIIVTIIIFSVHSKYIREKNIFPCKTENTFIWNGDLLYCGLLTVKRVASSEKWVWVWAEVHWGLSLVNTPMSSTAANNISGLVTEYFLSVLQTFQLYQLSN